MSAGQATPITVPGSGEMFDGIARRYDRMNTVLSFGLHHLWRRRLVAAMGSLGADDEALDVACGTADVAISVARSCAGIHVTGLDPSRGMLAIGEDKVRAAELHERVNLVVGDAQQMPF